MKIWVFLVTFSILCGAVIKKFPIKKPAKVKPTIVKHKKSAKTAKTFKTDLRKDVSIFKWKFKNAGIETGAITHKNYCLQVDHVVEVQQAEFCIKELAKHGHYNKAEKFQETLKDMCMVVRDEWLNGKYA